MSAPDMEMMCALAHRARRNLVGDSCDSGKLFRFLAKHLVNDHIPLHVKIHADRQG
jgi:hypothetical protein